MYEYSKYYTIPEEPKQKYHNIINKRANDDSENITNIESFTNSISQSQKKEENSQSDDYSYFGNIKKINFKSNSDYSSINTSKNSSSSNINISIESWTRSDYSKECIEEERKKELENSNNIEPIKKQLNDLLGKLRNDNAQNINSQIFEMIKNKDDYQILFIKIFFHKVLKESTNVELYAKLFKNLDKQLSQKYKKNEEGKRISSKFRTKLP